MSLPHDVIRDFKPVAAGGRRQRAPVGRWLPWFAAGLGLPLLMLGLVSPDGAPPRAVAAVEAPGPVTSPATGAAPPTFDASPPAAAVAAPDDAAVATPADEAPAPFGEALVLEVRPGDSLDRLFKRHGLDRGDLAAIMQLDLAAKHLRLVRPGDRIEVRHEAGRILALGRDVGIAEVLAVSRATPDAGFGAELIGRTLERHRQIATGTIDSSLFGAAAQAGISDRTIMNLAGIFAWDIDFVLDIRRGDEFRVVYEELWRDGERVGEGDILAAEFVNQGEVFRALRYVGEDGRADYFTPDGRNLRKAFVRAPLTFSRISSNFNPRRRHPKLNTIRAHRGVDYAAPTGAPVKAAGDGKVIFRGTKGGYGNTLILQHGGNITTLYAHLSRFGNYRSGSRVRQGEIIGYVGATGLATGPHLHYEYRVNGVHMNPRTVKLPDAAPLEPAQMEAFRATTADLLAVLEAGEPLLAAQPGNPTS